ncbi:MAG: hypothetical protein JWO56_2107, partial [Acidobacteria bacterium]|nr:hypothetical protein [Acidobacteriota bacterium]
FLPAMRLRDIVDVPAPATVHILPGHSSTPRITLFSRSATYNVPSFATATPRGVNGELVASTSGPA